MQRLYGKTDVMKEVMFEIKHTVQEVNKLLLGLEDGLYKLDIIGEILNLKHSDINLGHTYLDRMSGNIRKPFNPQNIFSYTFTFQEAVEKLIDRHSVDLRILFIQETFLSATVAAAEETCICNPSWFGCVAVFSIRYLEKWAYDKSIFAHEIGHTLGMDIHDNEVYDRNPDNKLLMWKYVSIHANVWSPEARKRIRSQNNSCLERSRQEVDLRNELTLWRYFYCHL